MSAARTCKVQLPSDFSIPSCLDYQDVQGAQDSLVGKASSAPLTYLDVKALVLDAAAEVELPRFAPDGSLHLSIGEAEIVEATREGGLPGKATPLGDVSCTWLRFWEDVMGNAGYVLGAYAIEFGYGVADDGSLWQLWVLAAGTVLGLSLSFKNAVRIASDIQSVCTGAALEHVVNQATDRMRQQLDGKVLERMAGSPHAVPHVAQESVGAAVSAGERGLDVKALPPWCFRSSARTVGCAMLLFVPLIAALGFNGKTNWPEHHDYLAGVALPSGTPAGSLPVGSAAVGDAPATSALRRSSDSLLQHQADTPLGSSYACGGLRCTALGQSGTCRGMVVLGRKHDASVPHAFVDVERIQKGLAGPYAVLPLSPEPGFECTLPPTFPATDFEVHCICVADELAIAPPPTTETAPSVEGSVVVDGRHVNAPVGVSSSQALTAGATGAGRELLQRSVCDMSYYGDGVCASGFMAGFDRKYLTEAQCKGACSSDPNCTAVSFCPPEESLCSFGSVRGTCTRFRGSCKAADLTAGEDLYLKHRTFVKSCQVPRRLQAGWRTLEDASLAAAKQEAASAEQFRLEEEASVRSAGRGVLWGNVAFNVAIACLASWPAVRWLANMVLDSTEKELRAQLYEEIEEHFAQPHFEAVVDCETLRA